MSTKVHKKFDIIVIGGGLGGLLSAVILSKRNLKVCVLEKEKMLGGNLQTFKRGNFSFDTGMHYFGAMSENDFLYLFFSFLEINNELELSNFADDAFDIITYKGKEYKFPVGFSNFKNQLIEYFPEEKTAIIKLVNKISEIYQTIDINNIYNDFYENENISLSALKYVDSLSNNSDFKNVILGNNYLYDASTKTSSLYNFAVVLGSFISGAKRFKLNTQTFVNLLEKKILQNGGIVIKQSEVVKFNIEEKTIISCETIDSQIYFGNKFISAIHPQKMLEIDKPKVFRKSYVNRIRAIKNTSGVFIIYAVLKHESFQFLNSNHYVHNSNDVSSYISANNENYPTSFTLNTPVSGKKGKFAQKIKIMTIMKYEDVEKWANTFKNNRGHDYYDFKDEVAKKVINSVEKKFPGIKSSIKQYYTSTPLTFRDFTGTINGSVYGIERDYKSPAESYISVSTKVSNLYLTGQNVNLHGMLGVSIASLLTSSVVLGEKIKF